MDHDTTQPIGTSQRSDFQRPDIALGAVPGGNPGPDPEFEMLASIDNGATWSSKTGNRTNPFVG